MVTDRTSVLGGEAKSRGLISGRKSKGVTVAWVLTGVASCLLLLFFQFYGLVVAGILTAVVLVATLDMGTGNTPWSRFQDRRRMLYRRGHGLVDFVPVEYRPEDLAAGSV